MNIVKVVNNLEHVELLLEKHEKMIHKILKEYKYFVNNTIFEYDDLLQEARIGFLEAYRTFDKTKGVKFSTYATFKIKNHLYDFITDKKNIIKLPSYFITIWKVIEENDFKESDAKKVSELTNRPIKQVFEAFKWYKQNRMKSLSQPIKGKNDKKEITYEEFATNEDDLTIIFTNEFLDTLDAKTKMIVILKMKDLSQKEIGEMLNLTQNTISYFLRKATKQYENFE